MDHIYIYIRINKLLDEELIIYVLIMWVDRIVEWFNTFGLFLP